MNSTMYHTTTMRLQSILNMAFLAILAIFIGFVVTGPAYELPGTLIVLAAIGILSIVLLPRLVWAEGGGFITIVLLFGLLLKLCSSFLNYYFANTLYGGTADALGYDTAGAIISSYIWHLQLDKIVPFLQWGTEFIKFFTGAIYAIIGPNIFGGFFVYAFLSFWGSYYFFRAFRIAIPEGNKWLFLLLVFFFPSVLYWPSAIGKDAPMFLCLGLFSYGWAQLLHNRKLGLIALALGFMGMLWIRPHIATIGAAALALAYFLPGAKKQPFSPAAYVLGLLVLVGLSWLLLPRIMSFLNLQALSWQGIVSYLQQREQFTDVGASTFQIFQVPNFNNPLTYFGSLVTLLFRPFLWESHNFQALVESLGGVLILVLTLWRIKNLGRAIASAFSDTYLRYLLFYLIAFVIIFASITNFGTLARERVMFMPFFFMLISFDKKPSTPKIKSHE